MFIILACALLGLLGEAKEKDSPAVFPQIPEQTTRTIAELEELSQKVFFNIADSEAGYERFQKLLTTLAEQIPEDVLRKVDKWNGVRIEKSLILMAHDRAKHPERYRELLKTYGQSGGGGLRVPRPPALNDAHLKPEYRCAWESLLLAPGHRVKGMMESNVPSRIVEAIGRIHVDNSLPVLEKKWERTTAKNVPQNSSAVHYQSEILRALDRYANEPALRSILKCLSLSEARTMGKAQATRQGKPLRQIANLFLSHPDNYGNSHKWLEVLRKFRKDNLSKKDKQFVEEALAKLEKNFKAKRKP
jgi:hypothetical protein